MKRFLIMLLCIMTTLHADVSTDLGTLATRLNALSAVLMGGSAPSQSGARPRPSMPTRPLVRPTGPGASTTRPTQPTQPVQPTGAPTPPPIPTGAPTPPPMQSGGQTGQQPTQSGQATTGGATGGPLSGILGGLGAQKGRLKPAVTVEKTGDTAGKVVSSTGAQPGAATGVTGGVQPTGQRPAAVGGLMGELAGRLQRAAGGTANRPQPGVLAKPGAAAPAQAQRPRVMRGIQEAWNSAVTMPMGNVDWNNYLPYNDDSYFNTKQNVMYSQNAAGQAINQIRTVLSNASYSQAEGFSKVNNAQLTAALNNLKTVFGKTRVALGSVTEDKRRNLLEALFVAITIAPNDIAADIVKNSIEVIALENEYNPGTIFSYLADMYVGSAANALRAEVDKEIHVKATEELQGVTQSKRQGHIATLGRRINAVLSRLYNALIVYEIYAGNPNISMLDKDLYLSKLMCSWHMVEGMYHELQEVLIPEEYTRLKAGMKVGSEIIPSAAKSINDGAQRLNQLLAQHSRPLINVLQVLDEIRERATEDQTKGYLVEFIKSYLPEVPQQAGAAVAGGKLDYEQQVNQQREALLESFIRCHYHTFDTQNKLDSIVSMLDDAKNRLEDGIARDRLDAVKNHIKDYRETYIRNQKVNKVIQRIETDPELSANPEKIKEVIDDIAQMVQKKDIEIKEAQDLLDALAPRYDVIAFANKLAIELGDALTKICYVGERNGILGIINSSIYQNEKYINPQIEQTKISISADGTISQTTSIVPVVDLGQTQQIILQSVVAYLTDLLYKNEVYRFGNFKNVSCLRCTYNGAWLVANELLAGNTWVDALKSLPYNNDGNKDENGKPTRGAWYPEHQFKDTFKQFYIGKAVN